VLTTTLQQDLQQALHAAMSPVVSGSGVVMDADDGSIIAMVSKPDFDPNILLNAGSTAWKQLAAAPWDPLLNKATELQGPPGSTFKVVTSLVALRSGALQTNENIPLGSIALPGVNYNFPKEQGVATFQDALAQSRDSYFMRVGLRVGSQALTAGAREMGLGSPTGFPMAEASGLVPDDAFMLKHHQRRLGLGDAANLSIGQGDLTVTPIQMAVVYASLVNGGIRWKPHLWLGEAPVAQGRIDLPPGVDQAIMAGLHQVTVDGTGTAAQVDGFDTWGKTGTAQVGSKDKPRQLAWFCGGFTHNDHHYVAAILTEGSVDELIYGGGTSAEVFGQMLRNWSTHDVLPAKLQIVQVTPPASGSVPVAPPADDSAAPTDAATLIIDPAPAVAGVITPGDISDMTVPEVYPAGDTDTPPRALPVNPGTPDATTAPSP
jgi:penicillin-binding protein 2